MSWDKKFDEPVLLKGGKTLCTLREAADYALTLPKRERDTTEWQAAVNASMVVAEHKGPTMFARIGVMQALNRNMPPAAPSERKDVPWGRRPLKRDR